VRVARHADFDERAKGGGSSGPFDGGEKGEQPTWDGLLESQIIILARERKLVETRFGQVPRGRRIGGEVQDKALAAAVAQTINQDFVFSRRMSSRSAPPLPGPFTLSTVCPWHVEGCLLIVFSLYQSFSPSQRAESYLNTQQMQRSAAQCHRYLIGGANTHVDDPVHSARCWYAGPSEYWERLLGYGVGHFVSSIAKLVLILSDFSLNSSIRRLVKVVCTTILRFHSSCGGE